MSEAVETAAPSVDGSVVEGRESQEQQAVQSFKGTKHRLKIDQEELELDYDDLIKEAQKGRSADKRFKEAAAHKKDVDTFLADPWGYLKQNGKDPYELAESLLLEKMRYEELTDEQREALHAKMELSELKKEKEGREKSEKDKELANIQAQAIREIDDDIFDALKSTGRKPTPRLIARIAENLMAHLNKGGEKVSAKDILGTVQKEYVSDISEYLSQMTPQQLKEVLPKQVLDALRQADVDQARSSDPARSKRRIVSGEPQQGFKPKKRMSSDEYFAQLDKKYRA